MSDDPAATPYEVLGVARDVSAAELRRAYRRRLRETHPDTGGDPARFHAVQLAWERVGSPTARAAYDSAHPRRPRSAPPRAGAPSAASPDDGPRVWTTGSTRGSTRPAGRARSSGHPGGWSRERYLTLLREWVGRGVEVDDPYADSLVARAPREIRLALADALAEEATARSLATLGPTFTVWHGVATAHGSRSWGRDAGAAVTDPAKIDHVVLGPTGLFAIQSEDWGAPVGLERRDLVSDGLLPGERPMHALARRAKVARSWRTTFTALIVALPDEALGRDTVLVRRGRTPWLAVRRRALHRLLTVGLPDAPPLAPEVMFELRTRLTHGIQLV